MKKVVLILLVIFVVPAVASAQVSHLTMKESHKAVTAVAEKWHPDGGVQDVRIAVCGNMSSRYHTQCIVQADGNANYSFCVGTVQVFKNKNTGRITTKVTSRPRCTSI